MLRIPKIKGIIDRRILINYRVDLDVLKRYLPNPFEPISIGGFGIVGICLIRLKFIRPVGMPRTLGIQSENGAHRIAVKWKENNRYKEGVFIPRRDTSSRINSIAGGTIFPGEHHLSKFEIIEENNTYKISFTNNDGTYLNILAEEALNFPEKSVFKDLEEASKFFEDGSIGYSPNKRASCYDCLELHTYNWKVSPLTTKSVKSSFFEDEKVFPKGSIEFDNALLMKDLEHEWNMKKSITT